MKASPLIIELLQFIEHCALKPYLDKNGWNIGYGHLIQPGEDFKNYIMPHQADELFKKDLSGFETVVNSLAANIKTQNQFDALVSWTYNLGSEFLARSQLLKLVKEKNLKVAPREMVDAFFDEGEPILGLLIRRFIETVIFITPDGKKPDLSKLKGAIEIIERYYQH